VLEYLQNNPGASQRNACTVLGVGRQSFRRWKKNGGPPIDTVGDGRGIFTKEQEQLIAMVIRGLCRCRKSPTRIQLIQYISGFAERNGKKFKSSQTWWTRFEKENNLKRVKGRGIEYYRVNSTTVGKIEPYYHQVESLFKDYPILEKEPFRIFNFDESSLKCKESNPKVLGGKDMKDLFVNRAYTNTSNNHTTIIASVSATGDKIPLSFVKKREHGFFEDEEYLLLGLLDNAFYQSDTGYSDTNITNLWFSGDFLPNARKYVESKTNNPNDNLICLFMDSASCHICDKLMETAVLNNVVIMSIPSNTSVNLQALDASIFGYFKRMISKKISDTLSLVSNENSSVLQMKFGRTFQRY